jgi:hypothetical protein
MSILEFKSVLWVTLDFERQCFNCRGIEKVSWEFGIAVAKDNYHYILPAKGQPYYYKPLCAILRYSGDKEAIAEIRNEKNYKVIDVFDVVDRQPAQISIERWKDTTMLWQCHKCTSAWALTWADSVTLAGEDRKILLPYSDKQETVASEILVLLNHDCEKNYSIIKLLQIPHYLYEEK